MPTPQDQRDQRPRPQRLRARPRATHRANRAGWAMLESALHGHAPMSPVRIESAMIEHDGPRVAVKVTETHE